MVSVNFIHNSLPVGRLKVRLEAVPRISEGVYLNENSFVVDGVNHVVYSDPLSAEERGLEQHCVYVYLTSIKEYFANRSSREQ